MQTDSSHIDLRNIVESRKLDLTELSNILFPSVKHPRLALERVLKGEALLDSTKVYTLSKYLGVAVDSLYDSNKWKLKVERNSYTIFNNAHSIMATLDDDEADDTQYQMNVFKESKHLATLVVSKNSKLSKVLDVIQSLY